MTHTPDAVPDDGLAMKIAESLSPTQVIAEAVVGYRKKLTDGRIPDAVADEMCIEYHRTLMNLVTMGIAQQTGTNRS